MDPNCPQINRRLRLIFHYYNTIDFRRNEFLSEDDLFDMVSDTHSYESKEVIEGKVAEYMALKNPRLNT